MFGLFSRRRGGARVVNQHVVGIRVRWTLMKAGLIFRCRPYQNDPSLHILESCVAPPCSVGAATCLVVVKMAAVALNPTHVQPCFHFPCSADRFHLGASANQLDSIWKI